MHAISKTSCRTQVACTYEGYVKICAPENAESLNSFKLKLSYSKLTCNMLYNPFKNTNYLLPFALAYLDMKKVLETQS